MIIFDDTTWEWIYRHISDDVIKLRLSHSHNEILRSAITQIECRQKAAKKLEETLAASDRFLFPSTLSAEQSTSDALAKIHAGFVDQGAKVLDLTCGLGIDSFHIAQSAASTVTACDINPDTADCASHNANTLGIKNLNVICSDCVELLDRLERNSYDCIFIDPARRGSHGQRLFALSDCAPDVTKLLPTLLDVAATVIIKASPMLDVQHTVDELDHVEQIIAIGTSRECKELVIICKRNYQSAPHRCAITYTGDTDTPMTISFTHDEEKSHTVSYGTPTIGDILYEPYPSVMKIAPFRLLSEKYGLTKLATNTHLYFAQSIIANIPCRHYKIIAIEQFGKKGIKSMTTQYPAFDISVRNFPISATEIAKKLKVKSGGPHKLYATTDATGQKLLVMTEPI